MKLIAITGGIATGKTTVSRHLAQRLECPFLSCDAIVHEMLGEPAWIDRIARRFGQHVVRDGVIDRKQLGRLVFDSSDARAALETLLHPEVLARVQAWCALQKSHSLALVEVPLLYEVDFPINQDFSIVVACAQPTQIARLLQREAMSLNDADARLSAQLPLQKKVERGDLVVWNDGTERALLRQIELVASRIKNTFP